MLAMAAILFIAAFQPAHANPSSWLRAQFASATSTRAYVTPGAATSTGPTLNTSSGNTFAANTATLMLQMLGSTTPTITTSYATTTYRVDFELSQDDIDWYRPIATSTQSSAVGPDGYFITLKATTEGGSPIASTTPTKRFIEVPAVAKYMRPIISIPSGTNGSVWSEWVAKKEVQ